MDDTFAEQKQLEFVLQAQGTFYAIVYWLIYLVKKKNKLEFVLQAKQQHIFN